MLATNSNTTAVSVQTSSEGTTEPRVDFVAVEEPLEIRVNGRSIGITMRTPGNDEDLARGLLYNEGVIDAASSIASMEYSKETGNPRQRGNTLLVELRSGLEPALEHLDRSTFTNSSCGVCGKLSIESIAPKIRLPLSPEGPFIRDTTIYELSGRLREHQAVFDRTGGLHAAALFTVDGVFLDAREDIGRHNAVDKLVGAALLQPEKVRTESILFVSGRAGFELVQKAVTAGIPVMAAVGAPSSLAVETAHRYGMTLLGFVRGRRFNIYSAGWRVR